MTQTGSRNAGRGPLGLNLFVSPHARLTQITPPMSCLHSHICLQSTPNQPRPWPLIIQVTFLPYTSPLTSYLFTPFDNEPLTTERSALWNFYWGLFPKIGSLVSPDSQRITASVILSVLLCWGATEVLLHLSSEGLCNLGMLYLVQPQVGAVWLRTAPHVGPPNLNHLHSENIKVIFSAETQLINHVAPQMSKISKCIYRISHVKDTQWTYFRIWVTNLLHRCLLDFCTNIKPLNFIKDLSGGVSSFTSHSTQMGCCSSWTRRGLSRCRKRAVMMVVLLEDPLQSEPGRVFGYLSHKPQSVSTLGKLWAPRRRTI